MAKLTGEIVYGIENKEKLKKIINALSIKPIKWDDLSLSFFDEINELNDNELLGHTDKHFYRANTRQMIPLIEEIKKNEKCSYVTPFNDVIKEGFIPQKISILLKFQPHFKAINEILSSQILNIFGLPTCYNCFVVTNSKYDNYVGSIDMIGENQRFYTFNYLWTGLYMCVDNFLEDDLSQYIQSNSEFDLKIDENKIRREILLSYLVRECLLCDGDFNSSNCGLLVNIITGESKFVNFDYEMALMKVNADSMNNSNKRILETVFDNDSKLYEQFINQIKELNRVLNEIEIDYINEDHKFAIMQLAVNIKNILDFDKILKNYPIKE